MRGKKKPLNVWKNKHTSYGKNRYYSVINKLKREGKIDEDVLLTLTTLSMEDIIAVKLELANRAAGDHFIAYPVWKSVPYIARDAVLKFALSSTRSMKECASFLGVTKTEMKKLFKKYETESFFEETS